MKNTFFQNYLIIVHLEMCGIFKASPYRLVHDSYDAESLHLLAKGSPGRALKSVTND